MCCQKPLCPPRSPLPPPLFHWRTEFCPMTTPQLASNEVAGCGCTLQAGNSISLAGSEELINFSQQSPKMFKMASESFIHALLLFLCLFLKISRWLPLSLVTLGSYFQKKLTKHILNKAKPKIQWHLSFGTPLLVQSVKLWLTSN